MRKIESGERWRGLDREVVKVDKGVGGEEKGESERGEELVSSNKYRGVL